MWPTFVPADDITQLVSYPLATVQQAFDDIVQTSQIDFNFSQGGCQQRAHLITLLLQKKYNIKHCKIWLFAPAALHHYETRTLTFPDSNNLTPLINWNYHVAPAVLVDDKGLVNFYVVDPAINKTGPLLMDAWFKSIGNSQTGQYSFYYPEKYFFNSLYTKDNNMSNVFDGTFVEYVHPDNDDLTMEKGLAINDTAMHVYHSHITPLMAQPEANAQRLQDLKDIFGNSTVLDLIVSQNISGSTPNTTHRYVITHYGDVLLDAKEVFYKRLIHWTGFVNALLK